MFNIHYSNLIKFLNALKININFHTVLYNILMENSVVALKRLIKIVVFYFKFI